MHEHDQELIAALAEGTLAPDAATAAATQIEGCAECQRDLQLQRIAIDALEQAPSVYLTATESARLHQSLHRELSLKTPVPASPQPSPVWGRVAGWAFGVAAVLLGAVLLLPALTGRGDDEASMETIASATLDEDRSAAATTAGAFEAAPVAPDAVAGGAYAGGEGALDDAARPEDGFLAAEQTETTAAPAATTASPGNEGSGLAVVEVGDLTERLRIEIVGELMVNVGAYRAADAAAKASDPWLERCLAETVSAEHNDVFDPPDGSEPRLVGLIVGDDGEERLLVAYVADDVADTVLAAISFDSCQVFETVP